MENNVSIVLSKSIGVNQRLIPGETQNQNRSLLSVVRMLRQPWVSEGAAGIVAAMGVTAPGRHLVTLPEPEFLSRAGTEQLWPSFASAQQRDWQFSYTSWMYFWNRQIARAGKPAFLTFERACFSAPQNCQAAFTHVYGTDLQTAVHEFQDEARSGRVVAPQRAWF